jgi:hypothetical protein
MKTSHSLYESQNQYIFCSIQSNFLDLFYIFNKNRENMKTSHSLYESQNQYIFCSIQSNFLDLFYIFNKNRENMKTSHFCELIVACCWS